MTKTITTFTARDTDGAWELELIQKSSDGWQYGRVTSAPAKMAQWVGCLMDFPPHEITG